MGFNFRGQALPMKIRPIKIVISKLQFHRTHTLCALSTVSGLCCTVSSVLQCQCTAITLGLAVAVFLSLQTVGITMTKLGEVFCCNVLKEPLGTRGNNQLNRNVENSAFCTTQ